MWTHKNEPEDVLRFPDSEVVSRLTETEPGTESGCRISPTIIIFAWLCRCASPVPHQNTHQLVCSRPGQCDTGTLCTEKTYYFPLLSIHARMQKQSRNWLHFVLLLNNMFTFLLRRRLLHCKTMPSELCWRRSLNTTYSRDPGSSMPLGVSSDCVGVHRTAFTCIRHVMAAFCATREWEGKIRTSWDRQLIVHTYSRQRG